MDSTSHEQMLIRIRIGGRESTDFNFRALMLDTAWKQSIKRTLEIEVSDFKNFDKNRFELIEEIYNAFITIRSRDVTEVTLGGYLISFLRFWDFCRESNLELKLDLATVRMGYSLWVKFLWEKFRRDEVKEGSIAGYAWRVAGVLSEVFDISPQDFVGQTKMPSGWRDVGNKEHENLDLNQVKQFESDLDDIIKSLSKKNINGNWPLIISFKDGSNYFYCGVGQKNKKFQGEFELEAAKLLQITSFENVKEVHIKNAINLRTQAECMRFMSMTGWNLQPTLEVEVGDGTNLLEGTGLIEIEGFKNRSHSKISIKIPKRYKTKFEDWIKFRLHVHGEKYKRLFPLINAQGVETSSEGERGFRALTAFLKLNNRLRFNARNLRYSKAQKLIRSTALKGNIKGVSLYLNNTYQTLLRSYLKGSQQSAMMEMKDFINSVHIRKKKNLVRNGGSCETPFTPNLLSFAANTLPKPDCVNPSGCLFCDKYRAVESLEYIHSILSYREFLILRSINIANDLKTWNKVIRPTIQRIDDVLTHLASINEKLNVAVSHCKTLIENREFHKSWSGWIEILGE